MQRTSHEYNFTDKFRARAAASGAPLPAAGPRAVPVWTLRHNASELFPFPDGSFEQVGHARCV